ncbi:MAG: phosphomethylpyrimidine kinase [Kordiimonas sp.]|nr:phosphomethylpyrimidine kinase [Kordiimonas sp.]
MELTKTNFIHYLNCPKSLWVYKRDSNQYPDGDFTDFMKKLAREGYEVERYVKTYFAENDAVDFQRTFKSSEGLFARADGFEIQADGQAYLYEVKSSTSIKRSGGYNQIKDACFQAIVAERSGQKIDKIILIYLNGEYIKEGDIDPDGLLAFEDVTEEVRLLYAETEAEIDQALELLSETDIDRSGCGCIYQSKNHHCDTFKYFNPNVPLYSIYNLPRLSEKKRRELIANGLFALDDIPVAYELSDTQSGVLIAAHAGEPQIDKSAIDTMLSGYQFPLYFFDYETFASAVPIVDGASPHKQFPVQYSLHILHADGKLEHREFLQDKPELPLNLVEQMEVDFGSVGSVVSWHASFEKTQNREMGKWFPDKADFLNDINDRMVDLEDIFKQAYVDVRFKGSTSIKKVLPVICPHIGYDKLDIQDGASAMDAWHKMIQSDGDEANARAKALLSYCAMDTFAMVEIYRFLLSRFG